MNKEKWKGEIRLSKLLLEDILKLPNNFRIISVENVEEDSL